MLRVNVMDVNLIDRQKDNVRGFKNYIAINQIKPTIYVLQRNNGLMAETPETLED